MIRPGSFVRESFALGLSFLISAGLVAVDRGELVLLYDPLELLGLHVDVRLTRIEHPILVQKRLGVGAPQRRRVVGDVAVGGDAGRQPTAPLALPSLR